MKTHEKTQLVAVAAVCVALAMLTGGGGAELALKGAEAHADCGASFADATGDTLTGSATGEPLMHRITVGDSPAHRSGMEQARLSDLLELFGRFKWDEGYDYQRERSRA